MAKNRAERCEIIKNVAIIAVGLLAAFGFLFFLVCVMLGVPLGAVMMVLVQMGPS